MFGTRRVEDDEKIFNFHRDDEVETKIVKEKWSSRIRHFFGMKTREEKEAEALRRFEEKKAEENKMLVERLSACFTTIDLDLAEEADKERIKREKVSQIRPRLSFSVEELKQIDEIAAVKRVGVPQEPCIDFGGLSMSMRKIIEDDTTALAKIIYEKMKIGLKDQWGFIIENIANKWQVIDKTEVSCWTYKSDDPMAYADLGSPSEIANAMTVNRSVECLVDIRNNVIQAAESFFMLEFERLLEEEISKRTPEYIKAVQRIVPPEGKENKRDFHADIIE